MQRLPVWFFVCAVAAAILIAAFVLTSSNILHIGVPIGKKIGESFSSFFSTLQETLSKIPG